MLSRLLEAGPTEFSAPLSFMVSAVSASGAASSAAAATPILLDLTASAGPGQSTATDSSPTPTRDTSERRATSVPTEVQKSLVAEDKVSALSEEDVAVSYIGDELDLKTVGDIIAIIEEKVQNQRPVSHLRK